MLKFIGSNQTYPTVSQPVKMHNNVDIFLNNLSIR